MITKVRTSAKAIIIRDGKILTTRNQDPEGAYYLLPGGGQEPGESLSDAVRRECLEEIGANVTPGRVLFVRDYIGSNHEFAEWDSDFHQMEVMFECELNDRESLDNAVLLDNYQDGIEWLPIEHLETYRLYPKALIEKLKQMDDCSCAVYLGDVN